MKKMRLFGTMIVSTALLLGSVGTALADETTPTPETISEETTTNVIQQGLFGTVTAINDNISITVDTNAHGTVTVLLTTETIYKVPGKEEASLADVTAESRVTILATEDEVNGTYTAIRVMVVPGQATRRHLTGIVVSVDDKIMTITNADGETIEVTIPDDVRGGVVGDFISAAVRQRSGNGNPELTGTQTAEQVRERLRAHVNQLDGDPQAQTEAQIQKREQLRLRLNEQLEGIMERHENALRKAIQRHGNGDTAGRLEKALEQQERVREQVREHVRQHVDNSAGNNNAGSGQQNGQGGKGNGN